MINSSWREQEKRLKGHPLSYCPLSCCSSSRETSFVFPTHVAHQCSDILNLKHISRILGHCNNQALPFCLVCGRCISSNSMLKYQILVWKWETRSAGLLKCPRILLMCFRARISGPVRVPLAAIQVVSPWIIVFMMTFPSFFLPFPDIRLPEYKLTNSPLAEYSTWRTSQVHFFELMTKKGWIEENWTKNVMKCVFPRNYSNNLVHFSH